MRKLVLTLAALIAVATFIQANSKPADVGSGAIQKSSLQTAADTAN